MDQLFVVEEMHNAFFVDEAIYHHGMTTSVNTPPEIQSNFDVIIYEKGRRAQPHNLRNRMRMKRSPINLLSLLVGKGK